MMEAGAATVEWMGVVIQGGALGLLFFLAWRGPLFLEKFREILDAALKMIEANNAANHELIIKIIKMHDDNAKDSDS